jgi:anti-sigma factor RsiW
MSVGHRTEHLRYRRFLDAYVDGELGDGQLEPRVGAHVAHCPMCLQAARITAVVKQRLKFLR